MNIIITMFLRTLAVYFLMVAGMRLMGKRQVADLQPSELVVTILISNLATLSVENTEMPMWLGILPVAFLVGIDVAMSWLTLRWPRLGELLSGQPKVVIRNGKADPRALRQLRFSQEDLKEALRSQEIFDISEVKLGIVETNGELSIERKE